MKVEKQFSPVKHPCMSCGACCAYFRVSFYWREAELIDTEFPVPKEYWEESTSDTRTMKGTSNKHQIHCLALKGKIGTSVSCSIYSHRPSPCRSFLASYEHGTHNPRCDEARRKHGLSPLSREFWKNLLSFF